jgi:membrane-associated phospholipid phosphatase
LDSYPQELPLPPEVPTNRFWSIFRRPILLASLVIGLVVFIFWLPGIPRAALLRSLFAQRALMIMLFIFAMIVLSLLWSVGQRLDTWVFLLINLRGYHPKWLDRVMWLVTQVGNVVTAVLLVATFFALNMRRLAIEVTLGTITLWLLVETIKELTDRARPFLALESTRVIGWREPGRSFPSGHTSQAFFLMTLFIYHFQPGILGMITLYAVALLVGFTRMYVGAHYPRDVIAGAVLGSLWGVLMTLIDSRGLGLWF